MTAKKIFLTDLDGTLLDDNKKITPATMAALEKFAAAGNVFAISTGRGTENAVYVQKNYGLTFPGSYVIAYNGAEIYDYSAGKSIYRVGVPLDVTREILQMAAERGVHVHTFNDHYIVGSAYDEEMTFYKRIIKTPVIITDDVMSELDKPPCKLIGIELHDHEKLEAFRLAVLDKFGDVITAIYSNANYLELFSKEAGKGSALLRLCEYLNIPRENSMAAGDAENDISMIQAAGLGIAMLNADDEVKKAADVVTEADNNHDGLVAFLG